jgi:UDP-glucose 4-epimerase
MKKVIVTGGAGFIGSTLVDELIDNGIEVLVLDNLSTGKESNINPKAEFMRCDVSKDRPLFSGVDTVFHLAATPQVQYSIENPADNNNLDSVINMLNISKKSGVKRFIFTSSSAVYGDPKYTPIDERHPTNPLSPYALHKLVGEQYCKLYSEVYGLDTVSLRYFNAYGDRMTNQGAYKSVISVFNEQHQKKEPLNIVNDGEQKRDFIHVKDIVNVNLICGYKNDKNFNGDVYNVGTGVSYSVNQIADMFGGERKYGENRVEPKNSIAEIAKINLDLDWEPKESLTRFIFTKVNK